MIVNLNLQNKIAVVIGGGDEAEKRIKSLIKEQCSIIVISPKVNSQIIRMSKNHKIKIKKQRIENTKFLTEIKPDIVITTTDDKKINQKIISTAKKKKIISYSSDNPEESDFANPAIIDFDKIIQIAIFTGGQSPAMSKKLRDEAEKIFKKIITKEEIAKIKIQKMVRDIAKETSLDHKKRKQCLTSIMKDREIDQLIKDGNLKKAEKQAITMLRNWK